MGNAEPARSKSPNDFSADVCADGFFPGAYGQCLENAPDGVNLHLGCGGKRWDGFINVDMATGADVVADLKKLPFDDNYADMAIAVHVFEHFYYWDAFTALKEWKRVLKPGGKLVLELPSMNKVFFYISECIRLKEPMVLQKVHLALWGDPNWQRPEMCHRWGWSKEDLQAALTECGFKGITHEIPRYHMKSRDMRIEAYKE